VPIGEHVQLRHRAVTRRLDSADAYDSGALVVYPVALTDDPDDVPLGFDWVYTGIWLPGGNAVALGAGMTKRHRLLATNALTSSTVNSTVRLAQAEQLNGSLSRATSA
jgi:hypothetical protein